MGNPRLPEVPGRYFFKYFSMPYQENFEMFCPFFPGCPNLTHRTEQELKATSESFEAVSCSPISIQNQTDFYYGAGVNDTDGDKSILSDSSNTSALQGSAQFRGVEVHGEQDELFRNEGEVNSFLSTNETANGWGGESNQEYNEGNGIFLQSGGQEQLAERQAGEGQGYVGADGQYRAPDVQGGEGAGGFQQAGGQGQLAEGQAGEGQGYVGADGQYRAPDVQRGDGNGVLQLGSQDTEEGRASSQPDLIANAEEDDDFDFSNHRVRFPGAVKQDGIQDLVEQGSQSPPSKLDWLNDNMDLGSAEPSTQNEGKVGNSEEVEDAAVPEPGHGLEHAVFGAIGVFAVGVVAAIVIAVRRRRGTVPPARKGDVQGDYVAVEMQPTAQGDDDFGGFAAVGNLDENDASGEKQALKAWDDGDGWDEFDALDEGRSLPTLTAYDSNGVKGLLDLERGDQGIVNIMVTFKSSSLTEISPFSCK